MDNLVTPIAQIANLLNQNGFGLVKSLRDEHSDIYKRPVNASNLIKILEGSITSEEEPFVMKSLNTFISLS